MTAVLSVPARQPCQTAVPSYVVYSISRKDDRKTYVGLTRRSVENRVKAHVRDAMRPGRKSSPGSLASAIRQALFSGHRFESRFVVEVLASGLTEEEARDAEVLWVEQLNAYAPKGFNILPAGTSVGGPGNARPATLSHPQHGPVTYPSLYAAIEARNKELVAAGRKPIEVNTVYARLMIGWVLEEALGYEIREDGRSRRRPFFSEGVVLRRLREVSEATGLSTSALRSRLHRAARLGIAVPDVGVDRRRFGQGRHKPLLLPDPSGAVSGRALSIKEFARQAGVAKATVAYRYHQLKDPDSMIDSDLVAHLISDQDRRRMLTLALPDGRVLTGGEREVVRQVLADPLIAWSRPERLSESGVRRRLRLIPDNDGPAIQWAFGFAPEARPLSI